MKLKFKTKMGDVHLVAEAGILVDKLVERIENLYDNQPQKAAFEISQAFKNAEKLQSITYLTSKHFGGNN